MLEIYKKGQGAAARWITAGGLGALAVFGCYELQETLSGHLWADYALPLGVLNLKISAMVTGLSFLIAAVLIGMVINTARFVDYLITSEMELRKVSWPTRTELKRQTIVVIFTLLFFGAVFLVADWVLALGAKVVYGF